MIGFPLFSFSPGKKTDEAAENRNYLCTRMTDEINQIIRVLQLTTYDEDEWDADNLTCMKKALVIKIYNLFKLLFVDTFYFSHGKGNINFLSCFVSMILR